MIEGNDPPFTDLALKALFAPAFPLAHPVKMPTLRALFPP
jgi:hypothetical protein